MKSLEIISLTKDHRTQTDVIYAQILLKEYFDLIGENYNKFDLQRKKEKHKGYKRLKSDIQNGALIPSITLAVDPNVAIDLVKIIDKGNKVEITKSIEKIKDNLYILDGLQRTHLIKELIDSEVKFHDNQKLLLEIWVEPEIKHLVYRLIVLNSGQKPMSMRHQIELLFTTMRSTLEKEVSDLNILVENEEDKRSKALEFPFERLVTAYYSFLTKSPEIDKSTVVSQRLVEEQIMDGTEEYLSDSFKTFIEYLKKYCELDLELFRLCNNTGLKSFRNWFADANVINSFFSSVGKLHESKADRIKKAIDSLIRKLKSGQPGEDILELMDYKVIRAEVADPKQYNVGFATRLLLSRGFDEFFRDEGDSSLKNCWVEQSLLLKK